MGGRVGAAPAGRRRSRRPGRGPYRATADAQAAVSRYGDPEATWSVLLAVELAEQVAPALVAARLAELCRRHPHLGAAPAVTVAPSAETMRGAFATKPYAPRDPLIRVAVGSQRADLLLAAHHGAVDELDLVALLSGALGVPAHADTTGPADPPTRRSRARSAVRRAREALFTPPTRLHRAPVAMDGEPGAPRGRDEIMLTAVLPRQPVGTTAMVAAAAAMAAGWNRQHGADFEHIVAGVGAPRPNGHDLDPQYRARYVRFPVPLAATRQAVRTQLATQTPEPDFPTGRVLSRLAVRGMASRLGVTFLTSNLGVLDLGDLVRSAAFYPVASGPAGIALGGVSTPLTTTLTLRTRRRDFSPSAAAALLDGFIASLPTPDPVAHRLTARVR